MAEALPRIHCIMRVKSELDVIRYSLPAAAEWASSILVMDNGSDDGSDAFVAEFARHHPDDVQLQRYPHAFSNSMVGAGVRSIRHRARRGDWWCVLDADELYPTDPRSFLARVPAGSDVVIANFLQFYLTDVEVAASSQGGWRPDRTQHYLLNWSEFRFVRHQPFVPWRSLWPINMPSLRRHHTAIPVLHYQYRSPDQIRRRLGIRLVVADDFRHEQRDWCPVGADRSVLAFADDQHPPTDWRSRVVRASALRRWDGHVPVDAQGPPIRNGLLDTAPLIRSLAVRSLDRVRRASGRPV